MTSSALTRLKKAANLTPVKAIITNPEEVEVDMKSIKAGAK
jgi:hypothetical protein